MRVPIAANVSAGWGLDAGHRLVCGVAAGRAQRLDLKRIRVGECAQMCFERESREKPGEPLERFCPTCLMERVSSLVCERPLIDNELRSLAVVRERQCHERLLVVRIRLFPLERVHEAAGRIDHRISPAEMECLSLRRLHRDAVAPAVANIEIEGGSGEPCGTPPLGELTRLDARREHPLSRRLQNRLQTQSQTTPISPHTEIVAVSQTMRRHPWFRGARSEVDDFTSTPRRSVPRLLGGAAVLWSPLASRKAGSPHRSNLSRTGTSLGR